MARLLTFGAVGMLVIQLATTRVQAQPTGGRSGLSFLQIPSEARSVALGSRHLTIPGRESGLFLQNPALLDTSKNQSLSLSVLPYLADTRFINLSYTHKFKKMKGVWAGGIQYLNYGTLPQTDDLGNTVGEFRAADYALTAGYGHTIEHITLGASLKLVGSMIEQYQLWGLALDWGAIFKHPSQDLTAGFVVKNMGFLRQNYGGGDAPPLPLDVRLGLTFRPQYLPLRISLTAHHLNKFDIVYNDPALFYDFDALGNRIPRKIALPEKLLRHLTLGTELLIHPNFRLMLGYDHLRRQELRLQTRQGLEGISLGAWLRVGAFEFGYALAQYTPGLAAHTFSAQVQFRK